MQQKIATLGVAGGLSGDPEGVPLDAREHRGRQHDILTVRQAAHSNARLNASQHDNHNHGSLRAPRFSRPDSNTTTLMS